MNAPTTTAQDGERERICKDLRNRQTVIDKRAAKMIETQSAELAALRAQVEGLRNALAFTGKQIEKIIEWRAGVSDGLGTLSNYIAICLDDPKLGAPQPVAKEK